MTLLGRQALEELKELVTSFEDKTKEFKVSACLDAQAVLSRDDLATVEIVIDDFTRELHMYVKSYASFVTKHMAVIKSPTLAPAIKTEFAQSSQKVDQTKKIGEGLLAAAKSKVSKVQAEVKKELLELAKAELKDSIKELTVPSQLRPLPPLHAP